MKISHTSSWIQMVIKLRSSGNLGLVIMWLKQGCSELGKKRKNRKFLMLDIAWLRDQWWNNGIHIFQDLSWLLEAAIEVRWDWSWCICRVQPGRETTLYSRVYVNIEEAMLPLNLSFNQVAFINFQSKLASLPILINSHWFKFAFLPPSNTLRIHPGCIFLRILYIWIGKTLLYVFVYDNSSQTLYLCPRESTWIWT